METVLKVIESPQFWVVMYAASELIGMNPYTKSNSVIQLIVSGIMSLKPKK